MSLQSVYNDLMQNFDGFQNVFCNASHPGISLENLQASVKVLKVFNEKLCALANELQRLNREESKEPEEEGGEPLAHGAQQRPSAIHPARAAIIKNRLDGCQTALETLESRIREIKGAVQVFGIKNCDPVTNVTLSTKHPICSLSLDPLAHTASFLTIEDLALTSTTCRSWQLVTQATALQYYGRFIPKMGEYYRQLESLSVEHSRDVISDRIGQVSVICTYPALFNTCFPSQFAHLEFNVQTMQSTLLSFLWAVSQTRLGQHDRERENRMEEPINWEAIEAETVAPLIEEFQRLSESFFSTLDVEMLQDPFQKGFISGKELLSLWMRMKKEELQGDAVFPLFKPFLDSLLSSKRFTEVADVTSMLAGPYQHFNDIQVFFMPYLFRAAQGLARRFGEKGATDAWQNLVSLGYPFMPFLDETLDVVLTLPQPKRDASFLILVDHLFADRSFKTKEKRAVVSKLHIAQMIPKGITEEERLNALEDISREFRRQKRFGEAALVAALIEDKLRQTRALFEVTNQVLDEEGSILANLIDGVLANNEGKFSEELLPFLLALPPDEGQFFLIKMIEKSIQNHRMDQVRKLVPYVNDRERFVELLSSSARKEMDYLRYHAARALIGLIPHEPTRQTELEFLENHKRAFIEGEEG